MTLPGSIWLCFKLLINSIAKEIKTNQVTSPVWPKSKLKLLHSSLVLMLMHQIGVKAKIFRVGAGQFLEI